MIIFLQNPSFTPELHDIVYKLAKKHTSRYPINVTETDGELSAEFIDPRFPNFPVCKVTYYDREFTIRSPYIKNNMYKEDSPGYRTFKTKDSKKAVSILQRYVQNPDPRDTAAILCSEVQDIYTKWKLQYYSEITNKIRNITTWDIANDVVDYLSGNTPPYASAALQTIANPEFVAMFKENQLRQTQDRPNRLLFINPDGIVYVSSFTAKSTKGSIGNRYPESFRVITFDELSPHFKSSISMLKMVDMDTFVMGVGVQTGPNTFWVYE